MDAVDSLTLPLLLLALAALLAVLVSHVTARIGIPAPAMFLAAGVLINIADDGHHAPLVTPQTVAQVGTIALVLILFEGGFTGGWQRMRGALVPVLSLGVLGTFVTTGLLALAGHALLGLSWPVSALVAVALAPTDPAAVFSVLGSRDVRGRSSAIIEGESGANDPVAIALMAGAIDVVNGHGSFMHMVATFLEELAIGAAAGAALGMCALAIMRRTQLQSALLLPLATVASAFGIYAATDLVHGSGFLAVLVAGLILGDGLRHDAAVENVVGLGSALAEIVMFTLLGVLGSVHDVFDQLGPGLVMFLVLTLVIRPLVVLPLLAPVKVERTERLLIWWGGLKGAVPVLLAAYVLLERTAGADTVFAIVFIAVAASVLVQGATLPAVIDRLGLASEDANSSHRA